MSNVLFFNNGKRRRESRVRIDAEFYLATVPTVDEEREIKHAVENAIRQSWITNSLNVDVRVENRCEHGNWTVACVDCQAGRELTVIASELGILR